MPSNRDVFLAQHALVTEVATRPVAALCDVHVGRRRGCMLVAAATEAAFMGNPDPEVLSWVVEMLADEPAGTSRITRRATAARTAWARVVGLVATFPQLYTPTRRIQTQWLLRQAYYYHVPEATVWRILFHPVVGLPPLAVLPDLMEDVMAAGYKLTPLHGAWLTHAAFAAPCSFAAGGRADVAAWAAAQEGVVPIWDLPAPLRTFCVYRKPLGVEAPERMTVAAVTALVTALYDTRPAEGGRVRLHIHSGVNEWVVDYALPAADGESSETGSVSTASAGAACGVASGTRSNGPAAPTYDAARFGRERLIPNPELLQYFATPKNTVQLLWLGLTKAHVEQLHAAVTALEGVGKERSDAPLAEGEQHHRPLDGRLCTQSEGARVVRRDLAETSTEDRHPLVAALLERMGAAPPPPSRFAR